MLHCTFCSRPPEVEQEHGQCQAPRDLIDSVLFGSGPPGPRDLIDSVQAGGKISATSMRAALAGEPHYASSYANFLRGKGKSTPFCSHGSPITLTNNVTNGDGVIVVNVLNGDGVNDDGTNVPDDDVTNCHNVADADVVDGGAV